MIKATPFHIRAADRNNANAWTQRSGFTLSQFYSGVEEEALTARAGAVIIDMSFRARLHMSGPSAMDFLTRLATRDVSRLAIGAAAGALWLGDDGVMTGEGTIARLGRENFVVEAESGAKWVVDAAAPFGLSPARDEAGLLLIGPAATHILFAAGLSMPKTMTIEGAAWGGLDVVLSRFGAGTEIWCRAGDAEQVWDRLMKTGGKFGLLPAGLAALDILEMETMPPRAERIDEEHRTFNGRGAYLRRQEAKTLIGVDIDGDTPVPHALLMRHGTVSGQIRSSLYSPALGRAIALAEVNNQDAEPGTEFTLSLPPDADHPAPRSAMARAVRLPFLPL